MQSSIDTAAINHLLINSMQEASQVRVALVRNQINNLYKTLSYTRHE